MARTEPLPEYITEDFFQYPFEKETPIFDRIIACFQWTGASIWLQLQPSSLIST